jgi:hypothetical protein
LGSVLLLGQFSLERGDLLLGLCERCRRAAHLRDEFVKGGAVHCSPRAQSPLGDPENCIAEKVNQRLTLKIAKALGLEQPPTLLLVCTDEVIDHKSRGMPERPCRPQTVAAGFIPDGGPRGRTARAAESGQVWTAPGWQKLSLRFPTYRNQCVPGY